MLRSRRLPPQLLATAPGRPPQVRAADAPKPLATAIRSVTPSPGAVSRCLYLVGAGRVGLGVNEGLRSGLAGVLGGC